ncbi:MAG TPA: hypothetical protein VNZ68_10770 [Rhodocyclaceae bacterium]|nr:hypothetical protein [Rhodocyclaceae bacterium]
MSSPSEAQNKFDPSQPLGDLIFLALDHGVDSIRKGGPLVPFVMSETQGKRNLSRFVTEPYEKAVTEAKASIAKLPPQTDRYAIAYDGFITIEGKKYDAIIVHGAERGKEKAYLLAQRYVPSAAGKTLETIGNPAFIGKEDALLR